MTLLSWAFFIGWVLSLAIGAAAAYVVHRRFVAHASRTLNAERLAELGMLTSGLAHEIRNPLSTVQLNLQLMEEDLNDTPARQRVTSRLKNVQREIARVRDILDDFLRYGGRLELQPEPVELQGMLQDLVDFLYPQAQLSKVEMRLGGDGPIDMLGDATLLKQAVLNLMINAMQAMAQQGGGELMITSAVTAKEATISVIDTGPGMSPEQLENIFRAYYSTKRGGTGLGLPMTRRIIEAHQGSIKVDSEEGKGTQFTITLPLPTKQAAPSTRTTTEQATPANIEAD